MSEGKSKISLTPEQSEAIEAAFGHHITELPFQVEEFELGSNSGGKLRVLKIDNVAQVQSAVLAGGVVVN
jgi:hypothetical protein